MLTQASCRVKCGNRTGVLDLTLPLVPGGPQLLHALLLQVHLAAGAAIRHLPSCLSLSWPS
jgi:hypothetical protein